MALTVGDAPLRHSRSGTNPFDLHGCGRTPSTFTAGAALPRPSRAAMLYSTFEDNTSGKPFFAVSARQPDLFAGQLNFIPPRPPRALRRWSRCNLRRSLLLFTHSLPLVSPHALLLLYSDLALPIYVALVPTFLPVVSGPLFRFVHHTPLLLQLLPPCSIPHCEASSNVCLRETKPPPSCVVQADHS